MMAFFAVLTAVFALAYIAAKYQRSELLMATLKPATILIIIGFAAINFNDNQTLAGCLLILGLICGLIGDVFLLKPAGLKPGLVAFLIGHLFHTFAFATQITISEVNWLWVGLYAAVVFAFSVVLLSKIWPKAGALQAPVVAYFVVIGLMAIVAMADWAGLPNAVYTQYIVIGATLFLISDAVLGYDRLVNSQKWAPAVISITYYSAQFLFAASVAYLL